MLEILIPAIFLFAFTGQLAKRRSGRRYRLFAPKINHELTVGALNANTMVTGVLSSTLVSKHFLLSTKLVVAIQTQTAGDGPLVIGLAHSDYSTTEITEWYEAQGAWDEGDKIINEQSRRLCRIIGVFPGVATEEVLNDGNPIKTVGKFNIAEGDTLKFWAYNEDAAQRTDGAVVSFNGTAFFRA